MTLLHQPTAQLIDPRSPIEGAPRPPFPPHAHASVDGGLFRSALSQLAAGTSIVTMRAHDGSLLGLTATSVTSVSLDPPLVLVCVNTRARSAAALESAVPFVIHFLAAEQEALARHFASAIPDKFAGLAHGFTALDCPVLPDVLATVECLPYAVYPGGDHLIVVGRVVEISINRDAPAPLIYFRNQFLQQR